jgi:hypothetical protein
LAPFLKFDMAVVIGVCSAHKYVIRHRKLDVCAYTYGIRYVNIYRYLSIYIDIYVYICIYIDRYRYT